MLIRPSKQELLESSAYELTRRLGVTNFGDSSIAGTIAKIMAERMDYMWAQIEESVTQSNLLTATGKDLDVLGESKGVFRQEALPNHSVGSIGVTITNLGANINIPAGTSVWCSTRPNSKFNTLYEVSLLTNESADVTIVSEGVGDYYNVLPGEIDRCGIASDAISVTNRYSIYNGSNGETDTEYRERIFQRLAAQVVGTSESIRDGLTNIPGVRRVKLYPAKRGPGTFDILIVPRSEITTELLNLCSIIVGERISPGIDYRLLTPMPKVLDISIQLRTINNRAISDYAKTAIENAIRYFIDGVEGSVSLEALRAELYRTESSITSLDLSMWLDGSPIGVDAQIYLDEGEVLTLGTIEVR